MDEFNQEMDTVYGWKIQGDKIVPPETRLPKSVIERISWIREYAEEGLTFLGALIAVLAPDEEDAKAQFSLGAGESEWLPMTKECREWLYNSPFTTIRQQAIALALMYGAKGE